VTDEVYDQLVLLIRLRIAYSPNRSIAGIPARIRIAVGFLFGTQARGQLQEPAALWNRINLGLRIVSVI
jgi:hypothetical protein